MRRHYFSVWTFVVVSLAFAVNCNAQDRQFEAIVDLPFELEEWDGTTNPSGPPWIRPESVSGIPWWFFMPIDNPTVLPPEAGPWEYPPYYPPIRDIPWWFFIPDPIEP